MATLAVVAATWWWLGRPVEVPPVAADPGRIQCVSYAPFRSNDSPLDEATRVSAGDIEEDLTKLARLTDCVRTYSTENGLDQVPAIAKRLGLKVIQGLWLGSDRKKNRARIDATVALARQYRDTITAIVVGNEVLLRGELAAPDIAEVLHEVKAATGVPVTYADVWEYWLRNRELAEAVDFITIHILPYWEDFPISAEQAGAHVDAIRSRVAASFPGKDILIGEVGWPSAGRMREGALPSPANQARVLEEVMARARVNHYRVNLIEAFDQPWKRRLEGTVGGHWGLYDAYDRQPKFVWGAPVSNHPAWRWQALGGIGLAAAAFASAWAARRKALPVPAHVLWVAVAAIAYVCGTLIGWTMENVPLESLTLGNWLRSLSFAGVALLAPIACAAAAASGTAVPDFASMLGRRRCRPNEPLTLLLGGLLIALALLAMQAALGLDFDPRYRDFAFAPLTGAVFPFLALAILQRFGAGEGRQKASCGTAEAVTAAVLVLSAVYISLNEGFANWQALWFCGGLIGVALTLRWMIWAPAAPS